MTGLLTLVFFLFLGVVFGFAFVFSVLVIGPKALVMLGKHSTI
jgi:hypothetical protein